MVPVSGTVSRAGFRRAGPISDLDTSSSGLETPGGYKELTFTVQNWK